MEKSGIAQFMDKLMEGMNKAKAEGNTNSDVANVLPKPNTQDIGDGVIVWRWEVLDGAVMIESVLATRDDNQAHLSKDEYVVSIDLPASETGKYSFYDDSAKEVGQAILSAWNWKEIWKLHAGDFLLETLSQEKTVCDEPKLPKAEEFDA